MNHKRWRERERERPVILFEKESHQSPLSGPDDIGGASAAAEAKALLLSGFFSALFLFLEPLTGPMIAAPTTNNDREKQMARFRAQREERSKNTTREPQGEEENHGTQKSPAWISMREERSVVRRGMQEYAPWVERERRKRGRGGVGRERML